VMLGAGGVIQGGGVMIQGGRGWGRQSVGAGFSACGTRHREILKRSEDCDF